MPANESVATITLIVSGSRATSYRNRLAQVQPTTAHPLPGERILDLALTAIERQAKVRAWRRERAEGGKNEIESEKSLTSSGDPVPIESDQR